MKSSAELFSLNINCPRFGLICACVFGATAWPWFMNFLVFCFFIRQESLILLFALEGLYIMYSEGDALYIYISRQLLST